MKKWGIYIRLLIVGLVASFSVFLFSYVRAGAAKEETPQCNANEKCGPKTVYTEYILWESVTRNFLSFNR